MDRPAVFLTMPRHNGTVHIDAAKGFYLYPSLGDVDIVGVADAVSSLLGETFNRLLANALAVRDDDEMARAYLAGESHARPPTHMAMLHSDIAPQQGWLDVLWREMQSSGADFISAIVPIKEAVGDPRTSTAIGKADRPWDGVKNIHVGDLDALPETFTAADICQPGEVLLLNTGCWLADLRHPAWDAFGGFQISSRIVQEGRGRYRTEVRPEDWELSRHLQAAGATVAATRAVALRHLGEFGWPMGPKVVTQAADA